MLVLFAIHIIVLDFFFFIFLILDNQKYQADLLSFSIDNV
jgi:hypothetical protein